MSTGMICHTMKFHICNDTNEGMTAFSKKLDEKTLSASEKVVATIEANLESRIHDMKNALTNSHENLQKQVLDTSKQIQFKLEKSTEANLESHLRKLKDETSSNYLSKIDFNEKYNELNGKMNRAENFQKHLQGGNKY